MQRIDSQGMARGRRVGIMAMNRLGLLLCAAAGFLAGLPDAQAATGAIPQIDLQARCRNTERVVEDMMTNTAQPGAAFDICVRAEGQARDALQAAWAEMPQPYKNFCIRPGDYSASYIEWIACVELLIELKRLRTATPAKPETRLRLCPAMVYGDEGSIRSIRACPL